MNVSAEPTDRSDDHSRATSQGAYAELLGALSASAQQFAWRMGLDWAAIMSAGAEHSAAGGLGVLGAEPAGRLRAAFATCRLPSHGVSMPAPGVNYGIFITGCCSASSGNARRVTATVTWRSPPEGPW